MDENIEKYLKKVNDVFNSIDREQVRKMVDELISAYDEKKRIFVFGNGGSASTSLHFECDFNNNVMKDMDNRFNFVCLNSNVALVTALSNDYGYENVFVNQLQGRLEKGDLVMAISGSGNSRNVIKAVEYAKSKGNRILTLTGFDGGELLKLSDCPIHIDSKNMMIVEDAHMMIHHLLAYMISEHFAGSVCP